MSTELLEVGPMLVTSYAAGVDSSGQLKMRLQLTPSNAPTECFATMTPEDVKRLTGVLTAWLERIR